MSYPGVIFFLEAINDFRQNITPGFPRMGVAKKVPKITQKRDNTSEFSCLKEFYMPKFSCYVFLQLNTVRIPNMDLATSILNLTV